MLNCIFALLKKALSLQTNNAETIRDTFPWQLWFIFYDASQYAALCLIISFSTFSSHRFAAPQYCGTTDESGKRSDCFDSIDDCPHSCHWCQQRPEDQQVELSLALVWKQNCALDRRAISWSTSPTLFAQIAAHLGVRGRWDSGAAPCNMQVVLYEKVLNVLFLSTAKGEQSPWKRKRRKIKWSVVTAFAVSWVALIPTAAYWWCS